ncbi:outer membrane protein [Prosthecomicrobium hirschii]|uniref:Outer membrane protein beta-barrel domain-containing protein n=1 Tax=Prosthecodimorpha hirschii TaxID=665126 RepID=A0A0N8GEQ2_9HYPH|nr:outer membrane beta-barrel protein [Prosthecomicrobium hirschii]KPL52153.1 hypothetical protein ABB55_07870 [Prosthecomicrobium hirschii]MCW1843459.1 outer membrane beta-barrel protein [Prosthecomicrobium hirschii]TPQ52574.1 porin family protein [Prosthecomicrobium hirschii]
MSRFVCAILAGAAIAGAITQAAAADLTVPYVAPIIEQIAVPGGWYLRGDIGIGIERGRFKENEFDKPPAGYRGRWIRQSIDDGASFGIGIGYQFNPWLRGDLTAEYRTAVTVRGIGQQTGSFNNINGTAYANMSGSLSSTVILANAYADLGTYWGITPYVGGGLGMAYNRMTGFTQTNTIPSPNGPVPVLAKYNDAGTASFAWALHAGASYDISDRLKLDLSYRYLDFGSASTGALYGLDNAGGKPKFGDKYRSTDLSSNDFRLGFRYLLGGPTAAAPMPMPVIAKN